MSSRIDRGLKQSKEKHQTVLNDLLREEANRYCADCQAKGPRWASWNLGVFLCIRCAGIHRNLGVHISRVKSVNLDSWTPEQMESIQKWGNKRAGDYYECYLPEDFARPHGDSAMETLIRNKYERKLYMRKGGEPPANREVTKEAKAPQQKKREKQPDLKPVATKETKVERKPPPQQANAAAIPRPHGNNNNVVKPSEPKPVIDLLGMGDPAPEPVKPGQPNTALVDNNDEFDLFMKAPISSAQTVQAGPGSQQQLQQQQQVASTQGPLPTGEPLLLQDTTSAPANTIESIMSLYQSGTQQQKPMYGVPGGVYLPQQQQQGPNQPMMGIGQQTRQNAPQMNHQQGMQVCPPRMNMNQPQVGANQTGQRFNNQGMMINGANFANMGMTQTNMGISRPNMGMPQPGIGMTQPNMGMSQPNMGMSQQNMGMLQQNMGMTNNQQMMPNMMMMQNQMQNMNLGQRNQMQSMNQSFNQNNQMMPGSRHQYMTNDFQSNLGQSIMTNSYGANRPMMPSQQPILVNSPAMGLASANMGTSPTMGHTLSNQLWN